MPISKHSPTLAEPIKNLNTNLEGLREFLALVEAFLIKESEEYQIARAADLVPMALAIVDATPNDEFKLKEEDRTRLLSNFGGPVDLQPTDDGGISIKVSGEAGARFRDAMKGYFIKKGHETLLYRNCLISLISSAEWFLSQVLRQFFTSYPDAAGIKTKTLTLEDLRRIGTVAEAESYLISLRVDEIMWGGLEDWFKFLRETVKLSMGYLTEDEHILIEIFQRRNVMVHNNGVVHPSYLSKVEPNLRMGVKVGEQINITAKYLLSSIDTVERIFTLIGAELWKRLEPRDEKRADVLNGLAMTSLLAERYEVALGASRFLMEDKQLAEKWLVYARLNYWQAKKWSGAFEEVRREVEEVDFTAKDDLIQLAKHVLLDRFDEATPLLITVLQANKITVADLREWPIFKLFRNEASVRQLITVEEEKTNSTMQPLLRWIALHRRNGRQQ